MTQAASPPADRRVFDRFRVDLPARFLCAGAEHGDAVLLDVSAAGAALRTRRKTQVGDEVVIYAEAGIRLAGRVVRRFAAGFAIVFAANLGKLDRILTRLGLTNTAAREASIVPGPGSGPRCRRADGTAIEATVTAVSVVGVTATSRERPPLGTLLTVGRAEARVTAHTADGFRAEFDAYWDTSARNAWLAPNRLQGG